MVPTPVFYTGLILLAFSVFFAIRFPEPTPFQMYVFRGLFALSGAAVASEIPGFFEVRSGLVRAGGALGVLAVLYLLNPPKLIQSAKHRLEGTPSHRKKSTQPRSFEVTPRLSSMRAAELLAEADRLRLSGPFYRARQDYENAIELFKQVQDRLGEANALRGLGELERMLGRHEQARKAYGDAIELFKQVQNRLGEANARLGLAYLEANERPELAKPYFRDAAVLYAAIGRNEWKERAFREAEKLDRKGL